MLTSCDDGFELTSTNTCISTQHCSLLSAAEMQEKCEAGNNAYCNPATGSVECKQPDSNPPLQPSPATKPDSDPAASFGVTNPGEKRQEEEGAPWNLIGVLLIAAAVGAVAYARRILPAPVLEYLGMSRSGSSQEYEMVPVDAMEGNDYIEHRSDSHGSEESWTEENDGWDDDWGADSGWGEVSPTVVVPEKSLNRVLPSSESEKRINARYDKHR